MAYMKEKVAYLRGLAEGMNIGEEGMGKLVNAMIATMDEMAGAIDDMLDSFDEFSDDLFVELEEILVMSDVGVETAVTVVEELRSRVRSERIKKPDQIKEGMRDGSAEGLAAFDQT